MSVVNGFVSVHTVGEPSSTVPGKLVVVPTPPRSDIIYVPIATPATGEEIDALRQRIREGRR